MPRWRQNGRELSLEPVQIPGNGQPALAALVIAAGAKGEQVKAPADAARVASSVWIALEEPEPAKKLVTELTDGLENLRYLLVLALIDQQLVK
jgi:hypothetical protein